MKTTRSAMLFADAQQLIPGGVNSPVRAFRSVGGQPRFIKRAKGSRLYDVDGNAYIDYVLSWGPMILGHAAPSVISTINKAAANGTSYGAPTELEVMLARMIRDAFPSMEKVRLVSSGTEAVMSAIRVARGFTKGGSTGDGALRGASGRSAGSSSPSDSGETSVEAHLRYSASFPPAARGHVGVDGSDHRFSAGTTLRLTICQRCSSAASRSACSTWPSSRRSLSWAVTQACALPGERGQDGPAAKLGTTQSAR